MNNWVRCPKCGHKLFAIKEADTKSTNIEIKCSSCKAIVNIALASGAYGVIGPINEQGGDFSGWDG